MKCVTVMSSAARRLFIGLCSLQFIYYGDGRVFPISLPQFISRVEWAGDLNKKDASIRVTRVQFKDNGTYVCDVKNPPDITGQPSIIKVRVVMKGDCVRVWRHRGYVWWCGCDRGVFLPQSLFHRAARPWSWAAWSEPWSASSSSLWSCIWSSDDRCPDEITRGTWVHDIHSAGNDGINTDGCVFVCVAWWLNPEPNKLTHRRVEWVSAHSHENICVCVLWQKINVQSETFVRFVWWFITRERVVRYI